MGTDIHGWVEIRRYTRVDMWVGVLKIDNLVERNYHIFSNLFGVRMEKGDPKPATADRGFPQDISDSIREMEEEWGDDIHSKTFITATELTLMHFESRGWKSLVEIVAILANSYGEENVRMVVGFDD